MMKHKFLALTLLLSISFQVMANGNDRYDGRQYIVKGIKLDERIKDGLSVPTDGTAIISTVQVQAMGSYFDGGVFAKDTVSLYGANSASIKSSDSQTFSNPFHAHHLPVNFSYNLRRPKNEEIIDLNDDDGNLTLFVVKCKLESMAEGKEKNKVRFFQHFLENLLKQKTPQILEDYVYYPDISEETTQAVRISDDATFINNQPFAGFSADDLPRNDYRVQSIRFNPLLANTKNLNDLDWLSEITFKINGSAVTLKDMDGLLTQASLEAWKKFEFGRKGNSLQSRLIEPCIQAFNAITGNSDPFAVAGKKYAFGPASQENTLKISGNMIINRPILNENPSAGIDFEDAVSEQFSPSGFGAISPFYVRSIESPKNLITLFSSEKSSLGYKAGFLGADPLTIRVSEPASNIILKELEGGNVSLAKSEIHVTKNTPLSLEIGQTVDWTTERSFGPLKKHTEKFDLGNLFGYNALYTMPGLSVSMGPIFHENLNKTKVLVGDSWYSQVLPKAIYHFDKLFLDKLNELARNK